MEFGIIFIIVALAAIWFIASGNYKTKVQDPQTMRSSEVEDSIVELKKKILITCAYEKEAEYKRLYYRLNSLMEQVLNRHRHFVLDVEAAKLATDGLFQQERYHDSSGMACPTYSVAQHIDLSAFPPATLVYVCFFLWHGGQVRNIGNIDSNPEFMMKIIEFLIRDNGYGPAIFMKGMVRKYGIKVYSECFPIEAKQLLERAREAGVGSAAIELEHLPKYSELAGIKSTQLGEPR